jgi:hypothetical protein
VRVAHFYHLYSAGPGWRDAVAEHLWALDRGGFDGEFHVGIVGPPDTRQEALLELNVLRPPTTVTEVDEGWEQVTLAQVRDYVKDKHTGAVLYAHTKGAHNNCEINIAWRRAMTDQVVLGWKECAKLIGKGYDATGCHWLTPQVYQAVSSSFFGGTYWMASVKYLKRLPECAMSSRYDAEMWIGLKNPKVFDLFPGWPGSVPYPRPRYGRLQATPVLT